MTQLPPAQQPPTTNVTAGLGFLERLTIRNAIAIIILLFAVVPAYIAYRLVSDEELLDRFLSSYQITGGEGACRVLRARQRGEPYSWAITTGFAFEGQTRWSLGVITPKEPTSEELTTYCTLLQVTVDFMHGMGKPPNVIWQMEDIQGREGQKGER